MSEQQQSDDQQHFQCCICLEEDIPLSQELVLPCCGQTQKDRGQNYIRYCQTCIQTLASGDRERSLRCPSCREFLRVISVDDGADDNNNKKIRVEVLSQGGRCQCCGQTRALVMRLGGGGGAATPNVAGICHACWLGNQFALTYECEQCRGTQRIPHPMWRYQERADTFSTDSWCCRWCDRQIQIQQNDNNNDTNNNRSPFTHWRVLPTEIHKIPLVEIPPSWNATREELNAAADRLIQNMREERRQLLLLASRRRTTTALPDEEGVGGGGQQNQPTAAAAATGGEEFIRHRAHEEDRGKLIEKCVWVILIGYALAWALGVVPQQQRE